MRRGVWRLIEGLQAFSLGMSMKRAVGGFRMRIGWVTIFREIIKVTLFFAAGAALLVAMLQLE